MAHGGLAREYLSAVEHVVGPQSGIRAVTIEERSLGRWFLQHHPEKAELYGQINHFNPSAYSIAAEDWGGALARLMAIVAVA